MELNFNSNITHNRLNEEHYTEEGTEQLPNEYISNSDIKKQ